MVDGVGDAVSNIRKDKKRKKAYLDEIFNRGSKTQSGVSNETTEQQKQAARELARRRNSQYLKQKQKGQLVWIDKIDNLF